ncbi:MAG: HAD family phosphatase [Planctomycetaceae bacterium]|nr:HAD family phosphatase [Planctomycetaceae bacterium]
MKRPLLLFDVMGTLVTEPFLEAMPRFFQMSLAQLRAAVDPTPWIEFEKNRIHEQQFCDQFFRDGRSVDPQKLRQCLYDAYDWVDGMQELMVELHQSGVEMHALSNYPIWFEIIEEKLKLSRYLDWTFVSCKTGFRKPDPEAYRVVGRKLQISMDDCVFVDDRQENVEAARAVGMDSVLIDDHHGVREELVRRAIITA